MKKIALLLSIPFVYLLATDISVGASNEDRWDLIGVTDGQLNYVKTIDSIADLSNIIKIVGWDCSSGTCTTSTYSKSEKAFAESIGLTYNPTLSMLKKGEGYWIKTSDTTTLSIDSTSLEPSIYLIPSWNLVSGSLSTTGVDSYIAQNTTKGISISKIVGWDCSSGTCTTATYSKSEKEFAESIGLTYTPSLTAISANKGYWVKVLSIDYDKFIQNAITADPDLTSYANLANKSIIVMQNDSGALKTSLVTFAASTYKEVELSNFSASTLNSSDADINTAVTAQVAGLTGSCGNWNFDVSSTLNMTQETPVPTSGTGLVEISDSSVGDFTADGIYKKVVYFGEAISLYSINCEADSSIFPPSIPSTN